MARLRRAIHQLLAFLTSRRAERDLERELTSHLALLEDEYVRRGMSREGAARAARLALGGVDQTKERHRDTRSFGWLEDLRRDVPYALRGLRRSPGFTVAAILTLALGIGATTAIFSVVNAVLLRPLPYKDSDRLVRIVENVPASSGSAAPRRRMNMTRGELLEWRARTTTLSNIAANQVVLFVQVETPGGAVRLLGQAVSPELFEMLGARPLLGRSLDASDAGPSPSTVVLSAAVWRDYFHSDPEILGRSLVFRYQNVGQRTLSVVGVMPEAFDFPSTETGFWTPLREAGGPPQMNMGAVIARLGDGVSLEAATQEANTIGKALRPLPPTRQASVDAPARFELLPLKEQLVGPVRPALRVLTVAVALVLLIVCANVANLVLARAVSRQREIAVRLAIGAGPGRIIRQVLTESLVLASAGGALGILLAQGGVRALKALAVVDVSGVFQLALGTNILPRLAEVAIDRRFLGIALVLTAVTAMLFGIAPALHLSRVRPLGAMGTRSASSGSASGRGDTRVRSMLVVGQLTMATTMLVAAGLLINSFTKLSTTDPGYDPDHVLTFQLALPYDYPTARKVDVVETLLERLRSLPHVQSSGFVFVGPLLNLENTLGVFVPQGQSVEDLRGYENPRSLSVSAGYLQAMGVRLIDGRWLHEQEAVTEPMPILVNHTVARHFFRDVDPIGTLVRVHPTRGPTTLLQVVGVVEDVRQKRMDSEPTPQIFLEYHQMLALTRAQGASVAAQEMLTLGLQSFSLRVSGPPTASIADVRALINEIDPAAGIDGIAPMTDVVAASITRPRFYAVLVGILAGIAAVLAAVGIYGVLAYAVLQRTQEIGMRMALGAQRREVLGLVLRRGLTLTMTGLLLGIAGAAGLARYLSGMLYGLTPLDPMTYVAVASLFALVALVASYLPAHRATKVDPMVALRCE